MFYLVDQNLSTKHVLLMWSIVTYLLCSLDALRLKSFNSLQNPSAKLTLSLFIATIASLPPSPLFFLKLWNLNIAAQMSTNNVLLALTVLNLLSVYIYTSFLKKHNNVKYSYNYSKCRAGTTPSATPALLLLPILFPIFLV